MVLLEELLERQQLPLIILALFLTLIQKNLFLNLPLVRLLRQQQLEVLKLEKLEHYLVFKTHVVGEAI
jgi:hypothetical protein